jgi:hypothetical protein
MWPHVSKDTGFSQPNPWEFKCNKYLVTVKTTKWRNLNVGRRKNGDRLKIADATGILHSIGTVQTACRLKRAVLQGYSTVLVLCRQAADWMELCYWDISQHWYCADSLQTEQICATWILHSTSTVQTACRLNGSALQGYCTALVLCRQPVDWTELGYRDITHHWYCADSL